MKIFQLNEYEYWVGPDAESVIAAAMEQTGCDRDELLDDDYFHELTDEDLSMKVVNEKNEEGGQDVFTAKELLENHIKKGGGIEFIFGREP